MSRHRRRNKHFSRKLTARNALFKGLMVSLIEHGRITTTVDKAKELRRHIEPAITLGKSDDLATRRLLISRIGSEKAVATLLSDLGPRFKSRAGGYTRIIKIGRRPGDTAEMAFIEFVDYDWQAKSPKSETKKAAKSEKATAAAAAETKKIKKAKKLASALAAAKKKNVKRIQKKDRAASRA